jgi:5-methylcytosine-specific restriction endonuclease McrA
MKKGQKMSDEQKAKISQGNKGHRHSDEAREKMSAAKIGKTACNKGQKMSEEQKAKIAMALRGRKLSEAEVEKRRRKHSPEEVAKMIETRKRLGIPSGMKGKVHSEETKQKMRDAKLGKTKSEETRARMSQAQTGRIVTDEMRENIRKACKYGPEHPNWRGGTTKSTDRNKPEYRRWRKAVFVRDNYTCQKCGLKAEPGDGKLHAHHINEFAFHADQRMLLENGQTLCEPCHFETDSYGFRLLHGMSPEEFMAWKQKCSSEDSA